MKTMLSSRKYRHPTKVSILLVTLALITTMVGCAQPAQYNLTISSTEGGSVTSPGEGISTYDEGTVVNLTAGGWGRLPLCQLDWGCGHNSRCQ